MVAGIEHVRKRRNAKAIIDCDNTRLSPDIFALFLGE
jgi:hypothetical protein